PRPAISDHPKPGRSSWLFLAASAVIVVLLAAAAVLLYLIPARAPGFDEIKDQLAAATASHGCGSVKYNLAADRKVRVSGYLTSAEDIERVRRQVTAIAGIGEPSFDIALMPRSHCEMAALLGPLADPAARDGLSLAFAGNTGEISIGEQPSLDVRVP